MTTLRRDASIYNIQKSQMVRDSKYIITAVYDYDNELTQITAQEKVKHLPNSDWVIFIEQTIEMLQETLKRIKE